VVVGRFTKARRAASESGPAPPVQNTSRSNPRLAIVVESRSACRSWVALFEREGLT
jgi:hypothetical protein